MYFFAATSKWCASSGITSQRLTSSASSLPLSFRFLVVCFFCSLNSNNYGIEASLRLLDKNACCSASMEVVCSHCLSSIMRFQDVQLALVEIFRSYVFKCSSLIVGRSNVYSTKEYEQVLVTKRKESRVVNLCCSCMGARVHQLVPAGACDARRCSSLGFAQVMRSCARLCFWRTEQL